MTSPTLAPRRAVERRQQRRRSREAARALTVVLLVGLVAALPSPAQAQRRAALEMTLSTARLPVGESLTIEVVARGDYDRVEPPTSDGFDFENAGRSSQVSIVNGVVARSEALTFVAVPRRKGRWTIRGARLLLEDEVVATGGEATVEVVDAREALGPAVDPEAATELSQFVGKPFFVRPELLTRRPYVGQPFVLSWELYWSRNQNVARLSEHGEPDYAGFTVEDLIHGKQPEQESVRFGGAPYARQLTRRVLLSSPVAGTFEVLGPRYRIEVSNFFDSRAFQVGPPPLRVEVRPLPEQGKPASFVAGAVGKLALTGWLLERGQRVQALQATTGERVVLGYEVEGTGNLHGLATVVPPQQPGMRVEALPDDKAAQVVVDASGPRGKRSWQYTLTFDRPGRYELPPRRFAAFDPDQERYVESEAPALVITVTGAALVASAAPQAGGNTGDPAAQGGPDGQAAGATQGGGGAATGAAAGAVQDSAGAPAGSGGHAAPSLRPLAPTLGSVAASEPAGSAAPAWLWPLALGPWALYGLGLLAGALRRRRRRAGERDDAALSAALTALAAASRAGATGDAFAQQRAAVDAWLAARLGGPTAGLTFGALRAQLAAAGAAQGDVDGLIAAMEHCDFARFAPTADRAADIERSALELGRRLEALDPSLRPPAPSRAPARSPRPGRGAALLLAVAVLAAASGAGRVAAAADVEATFAAANAALLGGDAKAAEAGYRELLRLRQGSPALHYNLGNALVQQGQLGRATAHYRRALRLGPDATLADDIEANFGLVRDRLSEASRRRHRILHVFDESPELAVVVARAAPRGLLAALAAGAGWVALGLWWTRRRAARWAAAALALTQLAAITWTWQAETTLADVRTGVIAAADAPLAACVGVSEPIELPEGLELRLLGERADGRLEVRLPNGRQGCVNADALYTLDDG